MISDYIFKPVRNYWEISTNSLLSNADSPMEYFFGKTTVDKSDIRSMENWLSKWILTH